MAVLAREGLPVTVVTNGQVYAFYRKTARFRDKDFDFVRMKQQTLERKLQSKTSYSELSYTTEFGKNWQLWQVLRELHSNTLDENGRSYVLDGVDQVEYLEGYTYIIVVGEAFAAEYDKLDEYFLPEGGRVVTDSAKLQVFDRPSKYIYYRGMRVHDLEKPGALTYNFLQDVVLSEDRTASNAPTLLSLIAAHHTVSTDEELVRKAVQAPAGTMESELNYTHQWRTPSKAFTQAVSTAPASNPTAASYVRRKSAVSVPHPLKDRPRPWRVSGDYIVDREGDPVLQCSIPGGLEHGQLSYVLALLQRDLDEWEMSEYLASGAGSTPEPAPVRELEDVPF